MTNFLLGVVVVLLIMATGLLGQILKQHALIVKALTTTSESLRLNQETCMLIANQLARFSATFTSVVSQQPSVGKTN